MQDEVVAAVMERVAAAMETVAVVEGGGEEEEVVSPAYRDVGRVEGGGGDGVAEGWRQ